MSGSSGLTGMVIIKVCMVKRLKVGGIKACKVKPCKLKLVVGMVQFRQEQFWLVK